MSSRSHTPRHRGATNAARGALALAAAIAVSLPVLVGVTGHLDLRPACGPGGVAMTGMPGPLMCAHSDEAPPGVDVTEPVSTAELKDRDGAGLQAYQAAQELGAPMAAETNATTPAVACEGDGASGYRTQAMYVVEAGKANRFSSLLPNFKLWAAGTDDVVNRSAALTGGVRNLRYVTEPGGGGTCEAKILNVTVPAGALASFGSSINALQALGFNAPTRKYMMWTDATVLCGIANLYVDDRESQANSNNGAAPQYARIDSGCWGYGNGSGQHSVEAHEVVHTLGAVNRSAAHSTASLHCWDESDTMCYYDGGHAMVQVCPPEREYLLDCGSDDYFSTFPDPGTYLDTHWNAADSRFLVGGGDGTGGGSAGTPTVLGATIGVNNPAVPGLVTQVEVSPVLPPGRTVTTVAWKALRADCVFTDPAAAQTTVSCPATASGSTTVTVVVTDSTGATKTVTSPLTLATGTARPVTLVTRVDGQQTGPASVCTSASFPVAAQALDQATGLPIRGLPVTFTRQTTAMTTPATAGSATSTMTGLASLNGTATATTTYAAKTNVGTVYAASTSAGLSAVPARCTVALTGAVDTGDIYYGDPVTVTGTLTRQVGGTTIGVSGATVPLKLSWTEGTLVKSQVLATARTTSGGGFTAVLKPTRSGTLSAAVNASSGWDATSVGLGAVTVGTPTTDLTAAADKTDVGYGAAVRVTGRLTKTTGALTGVPGATITVNVTRTGSTIATVVGSGRTLADGTYAVVVPLKVSGAMSVVYAGAAGLPADSVALGAVTAGNWSPSLSLTGIRATTGYTLTGTVNLAYGATTEPGARVSVRLYFTPTSTGVPAAAGSSTSTTSGTFTSRVFPKVAGSYTARVVGLAGHTDASSNPFQVTVG